MPTITLAQVLFVLRLITLTGPDQQVVLINPDTVISLREPRGEKGGHFAPGIACLIFTADGKYTAVIETCATVQEKLEQHVPQEQ